MLVVADWGQTSRQNTDWVAFQTNVNWIRFDLSLQPLCPVLVSYSWSSEDDNLNVAKNFPMGNINITEHCQTTSERNSGNDESSSEVIGL